MAQPQNEQKKPKTQKTRRKLDVWNKLAVCILSIFLVGCISVFFVLVNIINDPDGMRFSQDGLTTLSNSRLYDASGNVFYELGDEIREDVTYSQIPQSVVDAFLSIEDSRFFDHNGFDLPRFLKSAMSNLKSGSLAQGGSTLTMQMIDNAFTKNQEKKLETEQGTITTVQKLKLKVQEIYLSLIAEQSINKEQIFEYYVNRIWFGSGNNTRGIQKAAQYFFNKDVSQLNLGEAAFLAGCINAPDTYNPLNNLNEANTTLDHLKAAQKRRNVTLELMMQHGYITEEEFNLASNQDLSFSLQYIERKSDDPNQAYITQTLSEVMELTGQDPAIIPMDIYTALNQDAQKQADEICNGNIVQFPNDAFDVGFSMIENDTGEIIAVGPGRRYHSDSVKIDNSTDTKQPGSSMKPLLAYASTFDILGWSTVHKVNDKKKDYWKNGSYAPKNSDNKYNGKMSLQDALGVSKNTTAAQAMIDLVTAKGYDYWIEYCKKLGYNDEVAEGFNEQYSIGGSGMIASPIQQASAYSMLANGGNRVEAHRVRKAVRRSDKKEFKTKAKTYEVISKQAAWMMSQLLEKVVTGGYMNYNEILASNYTVYGKSGTTDWPENDYLIPTGAAKDEWSVGYTNKYTIACWSGYTTEYIKQGYYVTDHDLQVASAFHITHYMLDYMQKYATYSAISRPSGISDFKGGYIKDEFKSQGDVTSENSDAQDACIAAGGDWNEETGTCKTAESKEKEACDAAGGKWDEEAGTCKTEDDEEEEETKKAEETCINNGGTWDGSACTYPSTEPTTPTTPDQGTTEPTTPGTGTDTSTDNTTGYVWFDRRNLYNIFDRL